MTELLPCMLQCEVPKGVMMMPVPRPRHAWSDVVVCPTCGQAYLVIMKETNGAATDDQA